MLPPILLCRSFCVPIIGGLLNLNYIIGTHVYQFTSEVLIFTYRPVSGNEFHHILEDQCNHIRCRSGLLISFIRGHIGVDRVPIGRIRFCPNSCGLLLVIGMDTAEPFLLIIYIIIFVTVVADCMVKHHVWVIDHQVGQHWFARFVIAERLTFDAAVIEDQNSLG